MPRSTADTVFRLMPRRAANADLDMPVASRAIRSRCRGSIGITLPVLPNLVQTYTSSAKAPACLLHSLVQMHYIGHLNPTPEGTPCERFR